MYTGGMATKTISVDLEAYERLRRARLTPDESFSRVIKRAEWPETSKTAAGLLDILDGLPATDRVTLERLDTAQKDDEIPGDAWNRG